MGRDVVITGGAGGLGTAVVDLLADAGAVCHVPVRGQGAARRWRASARVLVVEGVDLGDEAAVAAFYAGCPALWASIHVAGGFKPGRLLETAIADVRQQFELNLVTAFVCCREAVRNMRAQRRGGRIVNVGSRAAAAPGGGVLAYAAAKAAVGALTQSLAEELKDECIAVNAVIPSIIDTAANRAAMPTADFARWPSPAEIATAVAWLASPQNTVTSGALVPVYGRA